MMSIKEKYKKEVVKKMREKFKLSNDFEVPKIKKAVVNVGTGKFIKDSGQVEEIVKTIAAITGQKPLMTKSRKSIAGFKIREGLEVGMKATLRGKRMWDFIEKLVGAALPRVKDFQGIKNSAVDAGGNLNIGLKEQIIFPEILAEEVKIPFSLEITIVTDAHDKKKGLELFKLLGFPIKVN